MIYNYITNSLLYHLVTKQNMKGNTDNSNIFHHVPIVTVTNEFTSLHIIHFIENNDNKE